MPRKHKKGHKRREDVGDEKPPTTKRFDDFEQQHAETAVAPSTVQDETGQSLKRSSETCTEISTVDDDGPSFIQDAQADPRRSRAQSANEKPRLVPLTTTTEERRNVPDHLRSRDVSGDSASSQEKSGAAGQQGAVVPGAVAIDMAGMSKASVVSRQNETTAVDKQVARKDLTYSTRASPMPNTYGRKTSDSGRTLPRSPPDEKMMNSNPESKSGRAQRTRRNIEETNEQENYDTASTMSHSTGVVVAPPPMDDVETIATGDGEDLEANVSSLHLSQLSTEDEDRAMVQAVEAELVPDVGVADEELLEQLKRQAEQSAEERLLANAITAQGEVVDDEAEKKRTMWWKRVAMVLAVLVVCLVAGVTTTLILRPPPSTPGIACSSAFDYNSTTFLDQGTNEQQRGYTSTDEDFSSLCKTNVEKGFGQWYHFKGEGSRLQASTCKSEQTTNFYSQILVFSGLCDNLTCVAVSQELCGVHTAVGWLAEQDLDYYVLVKGDRESGRGSFTLTVDSLAKNEQCQGASTLDSSIDKVFGSTRNLTADTMERPCSAEEEPTGNRLDTPAAWYQIAGNNTIKCAKITSGSEFIHIPMNISLSFGSCGDLKCKDQAVIPVESKGLAHMSWLADEDIFYYLVLEGKETVADFFVEVGDAPPNSFCDTAEPLSKDTTTNGTTRNACWVEQYPWDCNKQSDKANHPVPGVWYSATGTGNLMEVSTYYLQNNTKLETAIFDATDGCDQLRCTETKMMSYGLDKNGEKIQWFSIPGNEYRFLVQSEDPADYTVVLKDFPPQVPDTCPEAISIPVERDEFVVGSTSSALPDIDLSSCLPSWPGVFFSVTGTGNNLRANTCIDGTDQSVNITVLIGSCQDLECVDNVESRTCDDSRLLASWPSVEGQNYFVHVSGEALGSGRFVMSVDEGDLGAQNSFCPSATSVQVPSMSSDSVPSGAITNLDGIPTCELANPGPGVWYKVLGSGSNVTASTCGEGTTFDTQLRIFRGSCSALECASNEDVAGDCGSKSEVTWIAEQDVVYYILVSGYNEGSGDFSLTLTA